MARVAVERCESCGRLRGEKHVATGKRPSLRTMNKWVSDGVAKASDGCRVEPDGHCDHGHASWLLVLGLI